MLPLLFLLIGALTLFAQAPDMRDRDFWNSKFNDPKTQFQHAPSPLLSEAINGRKPGRALDLGMGEGRNTIFLAQHGWQTTGVDLSDVAVQQATTRASQLKLKFTAIVDDLEHYDFGRNQWDLIALFYMHAWFMSTRPASQRRLIAALKPGGLLIVEGFAGSENYMFQPDQLLRDFLGLRVLRYEDLNAEAEWAPGHSSHIIRLVAEK